LVGDNGDEERAGLHKRSINWSTVLILPDPGTIYGKLRVTMLVMVYAVFPPQLAGPEPATHHCLSVSCGVLQVTADELAYYLADLARGLRGGDLLLLFAGCLAPAAPLLLFRLKRSGFANCRVTVLPEGLLLQATR
jgi:hypothetical protein